MHRCTRHTPNNPEPEEKNLARESCRLNPYSYVQSYPIPLICVSHTPIISLSVSSSPTPDRKQLRRNGKQVSTHGAGHCMRNLSVTNSACWSDLI